MMTRRDMTAELLDLARQIGLEVEVIEYCAEAGLVNHPPTEVDLAELRRIRRLQALEVNLAGIEVVLHMRRRMLAMKAEMKQMAEELLARQARLERDLRELHHRLAREI